MKLPKPDEGNFTPTPAGQHNAVLTRFIDLGTQPGSQMYPKPKHKVLMGWEIPDQRVTWEKDGVEHEGPVLHYERMTFSAHENAVFRQRLESWRGKPFTDADFGEFDCMTLLGVGALLQIAHEHKDGKTYANLQAILLPPGGKDAWAKPEGDVIYFSISDFDQGTFDRLSEGLQNTIKNSPEYQTMIDGTNEYVPQDRGEFEDSLDEVPF